MAWIEDIIEFVDKEDLINKAHYKFLTMILEEILYEGYKVDFSVGDDISKNCKTFQHLITREIPKRNRRVLDVPRAQRIHWIEYVLKDYKHKDVYIYEKIIKNNRRIIFLVPKAFYLVVIESNPRGYFVVTAYPLDNQHRVNHYMKQYREYKKSKHFKNEKAPVN